MVFLTPSLHVGGAERQMLTLAERLPHFGFGVRFILLWERGAWAAEAEAVGARVTTLGIDRRHCTTFRIACLGDAARALRRYVALTKHVDLVDAWRVPSYTFAAFAQPFARVPVVVAGRRSLGDLYRSKHWTRRLAARAALLPMSAIVANSGAAADEAINIDRVNRARVHVIRNAVLPIMSVPEDRDRLRRGWGFDEGNLVVGCVANYKPGKGLERVVDVAARLRGVAPALRYVLVGDGPLRSALAESIRVRGLEEIVVLNGPADDARRLYPAFDIAVQASSSEGLPNVILEAASAGLPIVATAVGGTMEVVGRDDAILVREDDDAGIAAGILALARDAALRASLAAAARQRAMLFSPDRLVEETATLYSQLLTDRPRRR
jgi:glycosyltransferase involved in cell wall biosynthesis